MAAPIPRGLSCLSRALGWWSRQPILVTQSPAVVPVKTKSRFRPPLREPKYKTEKEFLEHARKAGLVIPPEKMERPIHLACTGEEYTSMVVRAAWGLPEIERRLIRKIKEFDANFKTKDFPEKAKDIFIEAHLCLNNFLSCPQDMVWDLKYKTVRWSFVESLEPAQVVHVRSSGMVNQSNMYGQVTVRLHTRQTLAIYDRFGRLMYGQEDVPKDVLEYVVFERHLMNPYGSWRMHAKIVPPWAPPKQPILKTLMIPSSQLNPWEASEETQGEAHKPQLA
ncbi:39S ribosomal protein L45, mitochondrial [Microtus ochrogaster]|uniref:Large ribosomal subunit protein mL45 n=1 Tax=Microtus ochrogaster TaxID=79684 RepID=A0ABM1UUG2_MICOH|nr:39S ribosomal protein L45, mitochondrial [Microtus ochrogaster]